jgi:hypothetical protein
MSGWKAVENTVRLGHILEEFDERLGSDSEPEILTLTERNGFVAQRERFQKRLAVEDTSNYKVVRLHDVAFNPYLLWASAIAQNVGWERAIISPLYPTFRMRHGYDPRFVNHLLHTSELRMHYGAISFGSVPRKRRASVADFLNLRVARPPGIEEQQRIAAILDRAASLRDERRAAFEYLDALDRAVFLDMFGDPVRNDRKWKTRPISECGAVVTGNTPPRARSEYYGDSIEWIKSDNLNVPEYYATKADEFLSEQGREVARIAPPQAILVTCIAGSPDCIGNSAMTDREVAFNQQINAFISEEGDPHFFYGQIRFGKRLIQLASTRSMKGMVSKSRFEQIKLIFPPTSAQEEYGRRALQIEGMRSKCRRSTAQLVELAKSLEQKAFRGEL